jgi:hypothetical protein
MIVGVVGSVKVDAPQIARAASYGTVDVHAAEKRLSRHLNSEHWDTSSLTNHLLAMSSRRVDDNSLIVVDLTDLAKPYSVLFTTESTENTLLFTTERTENTEFFSVLFVFSVVIIRYSLLEWFISSVKRASETSSFSTPPLTCCESKPLACLNRSHIFDNRSHIFETV